MRTTPCSLIAMSFALCAFAPQAATAAPATAMDAARVAAPAPILQPVSADRRHRSDESYRTDDVEVDAPTTHVREHDGNVTVDAPFAYVDRSHDGVRVRAPFVDLWIPRR